MKKVSLNELKVNLAEYAAVAAAGEPVEVTRYNRPYVRLSSAAQSGFIIGERFGQAELSPVLHAKIPLSKILSAIQDDRDAR